MNKLNIEYLKKKELKEYNKNVRNHNIKQIDFISKSINKYGFINPIIIDENNIILSGHGRYKSVDNDMEIPCIRINHLDDDEKTNYIIDDNYSYDLGSWNKRNLHNILLKNKDSLLKKMRSLEIENDIKNNSVKETFDDIEDFCSFGDVYKLGNHLLICGDSENIDTYKYINNVDMVMTSPPYNLKTGGGSNSMRTNIKKNSMYDEYHDNLHSSDYIDFLSNVLNNIETVLNKNHVIVWNSSYNNDSRDEFLRVVLSDKHNFNVLETLCWDKIHCNQLRALNTFSRRAKFIFILSLYKDKYLSNQNMDCYSNLVSIDSQNKGQFNTIQGMNTATYPIKLVEHFIDLFIKEDMVVLDPFVGSGTTLYACESKNVKGIGIEFSTLQCSYIINNFKSIYNIDAVKVN